MKSIILTIALVLGFSAFADHHRSVHEDFYARPSAHSSSEEVKEVKAEKKEEMKEEKKEEVKNEKCHTEKKCCDKEKCKDCKDGKKCEGKCKGKKHHGRKHGKKHHGEEKTEVKSEEKGNK